jgi:RNA polymerase sigma-70 factor, ECF subfamily
MDRFLAGVERRALVMARVATGHSDDALDLVQEAMFKLAQKYMDKDESEWGALFHRILQSKIRDWYRRNKTRSRWLGWLKPAGNKDDADPIQDAPDPGEQGPEARLMSKRALSKLAQAVHSLPLRQQQAFMLRIWEGFDVSETARAMGCSNGSVKTHLSRALERLRTSIGNALDEHAEP